MANERQLCVGDRLTIGGGYDQEPEWLSGNGSVTGTLVSFIPKRNEKAAVVQLDEPLTAKGVTGVIVVLSLRYVGATWGPTETVHVELCDFLPESKPWEDRRQGAWVESHATYRLLAD